MSSGAKVGIIVAEEKVPGVAATEGYRELLRNSVSIRPTFNSTESRELGNTAMAQGTSPGASDVGGDLVTAYRPAVLDPFFESVFGARFTGDDKKASLTLGEDRITFSIAEVFRDIVVSGLATGMQVSRVRLQCPADGDISITTTFAGLGFDTSVDGKAIKYAPQVDLKRFGYRNVTGIEANGQSLVGKACVDTFELSFDRATEAQRCLGNGTGWPGAQITRRFAPTGSVTLAWSQTSFELWRKQINRDRISFKFAIANDEYAYDLFFPSVEISGDWPSVDDDGIVRITLNLAAAYESPVITRTKLK